MRYTVIGVWNHEGQDDTDLIVAGVIEGRCRVVDRQDDVGAFGVFTRFATSVEAESAEEAERIAIERAQASQ